MGERRAKSVTLRLVSVTWLAPSCLTSFPTRALLRTTTNGSGRMQTAITSDASASGWERSFYAFLAEKQQRSGSMRTVNAYAGMLRDFFGRATKTPDAVGAQDAFAWAYGVGLSGKQPSATTINARIACLSSYYRFLVRMELVKGNPCDKLERPHPKQATARGISAEQIRRLLACVPDTRVGLRDRAIILTLVLTGRRRAEVLGM